MSEDGIDSVELRRAGQLLDDFLGNRGERTLQAYTADLEEFARFLDLPPPAAVALLLAAGPSAGHRLALDYTIDLRRRNRAHSTIDRRLTTLRSMVRTAAEAGMIDWQLEVPGDAEVAAAVERQPVRDSDHYLFPRHPGEIDRLDVQHYALRDTLRVNHLSPVEDPARILDVGCGTGQWGYEMCGEFPAALVVGVDLVTSKPGSPPGYRYVRSNVLQGLPFGEGRFDMVYQRLLTSGVPVAAWPDLVGDLVRVTRPGGWVELVEVRFEVDDPGPAVERIVQLTRELMASLGLDTTSEVYRSLDRYLRDAGLVDVARREVQVPVGRWGGQVGSLMVTDFRAGATRVCEVLQARGRLAEQEARELIQAVQVEWDEGRMIYPFGVAYGRKPA